jgi:hypothetical protein
MNDINYLEIKKEIFKEMTEKIMSYVDSEIENDKSKKNNDNIFKNQLRIRITNNMLINMIEVQIRQYINDRIEFNNKKYKFNRIEPRCNYVCYYDGGSVPTHVDSYGEIFAENYYLSGLIYLNDDYKDGETYIFQNNDKIIIDKRKGDIVLFKGDKMLHGCNIVNGRKHIIIFVLQYVKE